MDQSRKGKPRLFCLNIFPKFLLLPVELQRLIWELALGDSTCLWAEWSGPDVALLAPVAPIPELGDADPPGLIPYKLPPDMPETLVDFPLPSGVPTGMGKGIDWEAYLKSMGVAYNTSSWTTRLANGWTGALKKMSIQKEQTPINTLGYNPCLALLSVCRLSRQIVLNSRAVIKTNKTMPNNLASGSGMPQLYPSFSQGATICNVFRDQQTGRHCLAIFLNSNPSTRQQHVPPLRRVRDPCQYTYVSARLASIEQCIFGQRLSLTRASEGLDSQRFKELEWAVWWRPDLGARARRPEASHPFHCQPFSILCVYSELLHRVLEPEPGPFDGQAPSCYRYMHYATGQWYFDLLQTGRCSTCSKPLMESLRKDHPELIDSDGYVDVMVLLDRARFERPEATISLRSHELVH